MKKKKIYMMGICGTAMGSLAGLLKAMGHDVRGSDQNVYPPMSTKLKELGISIAEGYKPENLTPKPDEVIVGNVMTRQNIEVQALLQSDIPYTSLPKAMGEHLIRNRHSIVISGTHGKTTTTAIAAWLCEQAGFKPGFMIGGVPLNFSNSFSIGEGDYFVIEGDEYDTAFFDKVPKFIHYKPCSVILTSVEFDHADIYKDLNAVKDAFRMLMRLIPRDGNLIYEADDKNIPSILGDCKCENKISYGARSGQYRLGEIRWQESHSEFDVVKNEKKYDTVKTTVFGEYNLLNALSVYALGEALKIPKEKIKQALASFKGVKRRQEIFSQKDGITYIDDFAHHPTAVRVTIDGVRKRFKKSKIIAVFEPRSATARRKVFEDDFAKSLATADVVIVSVPYDQSKIAPEERLDSDAMTQKIQKANAKAKVLLGHDTDEIVGHIKVSAHNGDVVLFMSNGGFGGIYQQF